MKHLTTYSLLCVLGTCAALAWTDVQVARRDKVWSDSVRVAEEQRSIWQARYAESESRLVNDTVKLTRWLTRWDTLRVVSIIHDTLRHDPIPWDSIRPVLVAADSTIQACRDLLSSCALFRLTADSTLASLARERDAYANLYNAAKPNWFERHWKGLTVGGSVLGAIGGAYVRGK